MKAEIGQAIEGWLLKHFDKSDIRNSDRSLYLRRFYLIGGKGGSSLDFEGKLKVMTDEERAAVKITQDTKPKLLLHIFYTGDEGHCLHDHPWNFVSYIIAGGYHEITEVKGSTYFGMHRKEMKWHGAGSITLHKAEHRHQVKLANTIVRTIKHYEHIGNVPGFSVVKKRCWTLVWRSAKKRDWGFWNKGVFTHFSKWKNAMCGE